MRICQKKANVELVVIVLRMRQRLKKIFANLVSITITNFDTDFAPGLVACWMRICQKRQLLSWWLYSCA